jgi:FkbM family methyltransferase
MQPKSYLKIRRIANALAESTQSNIPRTICRRLFAHADAAVAISDFDGTLRLQLDLSEHMQRRIFWMGYYSRDVVATLKALLRPGMQFIDIGANIGEISLVAGKLVGSAGSVTSFEPVDAIAEKLEHHIHWNGMDWCRVERQALSDHQGEADIFASTGNNGTKDKHGGLASLHNIDPGNQPVQRVRLNTLDAYLQNRPLTQLDGIKIDIEGAELACLEGAKSTLQRYKPWLIVEVQQQTSAAAGHDQTQILTLLARHGYQFYKTGDQSPRPVSVNELGAIQNVLCLHREQHIEDAATPKSP